jgi:hypothetical protein
LIAALGDDEMKARTNVTYFALAAVVERVDLLNIGLVGGCK